MPKKFIKPISLLLCFCFFFTQTGLAQLLPTQQGLSLQGTVPVIFQLPALRYLSVNTANPSNYFNFLLDRGQRTEDGGQRTELNQEAKKLIHYFFLGITLPSEAFWVNLKPQEPERITSEELSRTDLGRTLLEQDLKLKKDVAMYLHPKHPQGKLYWEKLYATISSRAGLNLPYPNLKKLNITTSSRVWIVPAEAVVLETEDGALVARAQLKVLLESEYFEMKKKGIFEGWRGRGASPKSSITRDFGETSATGPREEEQIRIISESLMKEIILPALTKEINESPGYAPLRQVYHSLILAEWFKRKQKQQIPGSRFEVIGSRKGLEPNTYNLAPNNPYSKYINSGTTTGLESELPWEKQAIWQEYLKSYQEGEYKLQDTIFGLKRMYFSGGMALTKIGSAEVMKVIPFSSGSPILDNPEIQNKDGFFKNGLPVVNPAGSSAKEGEIPIGSPEVKFPGSFIKEQGGLVSPVETNFGYEPTLREAIKALRDAGQKECDIRNGRSLEESFKLIVEAEKLLLITKAYSGDLDDYGNNNTSNLKYLAINLQRQKEALDFELKVKEIAAKKGRSFLEINGWLAPVLPGLEDDSSKYAAHSTNFELILDIIKTRGLKVNNSGEMTFFNPGARGQAARSRVNYRPGLISLVFDRKALVDKGVRFDKMGELVTSDFVPLVCLVKESKRHVVDSVLNIVEAKGEIVTNELKQQLTDVLGYSSWHELVNDLTINETAGSPAVEESGSASTERSRSASSAVEKEDVKNTVKNLLKDYINDGARVFIHNTNQIGWSKGAFEKDDLTIDLGYLNVTPTKEAKRAIETIYYPASYSDEHWVKSFAKERIKEMENKGIAPYKEPMEVVWKIVTGNPKLFKDYIFKQYDKEGFPIGQEALWWSQENEQKDLCLMKVLETKNTDVFSGRDFREIVYMPKKEFEQLFNQDTAVGVVNAVDSALARGGAEEGHPQNRAPREILGKLPRQDPEQGGIDLSQIELTLKDDKYISSLNPADIKILRAAKALKEEWNSLSLLYVHEVMLMLEDKIVSNIKNKPILQEILSQLNSKEFLDPQGLVFLQALQLPTPNLELAVKP